MHYQEYLEVFKLFDEKYERLRRSSFYRKVFEQKTGVTVSKKIGEPVRVERRGPNEEEIAAFVLTFRFFIQKNEKISFRKIAKHYDSLSISEEKKRAFGEARKRLNEFLNSESYLKINGRTLTYQHILHTFVYGDLSHANGKKKKIHDQWMRYPAFNEMIKNEFISALGRVMQFIAYVKRLNDEVIKELEENNQKASAK